MRQLTLRGYQGEQDLRSLSDLALVSRQTPHLTDLPYRLASPSLEDRRNAALWVDGRGTLAAWAALQFPWLTVDYAIAPAIEAGGVREEIVAWATERLGEVARERGKRIIFNFDVGEGDEAWAAWLEDRGFTRERWHVVRLARALDAPIPRPEPPAGFTLRSLRGQAEVADYVRVHRAAFGSTAMTEAWRSRTLQIPGYRPELDVVMAGPDGLLAGFCVCWLSAQDDARSGHSQGQVEPAGVHPSFQRRGLGRALLLEGLHRLQAHGAHSVVLDVYSGNTAAQGLYEAVGFRPRDRIFKYFKWFDT